MADDGKRTEVVCFKVTERMALDLNRLAALEDRSISDFLYGSLRRRLYGDIVRLDSLRSQSTKSDDVDRGAD
jgi:hypothetical protein